MRTKHIYEWSLKRSGNGMTLCGKNYDGCTVIYPGIIIVSVQKGAVLASHHDGTVFHLCCGTPHASKDAS